ncbi:peptidoglycan editing factor PgeF [Alkalihalobacillus sp. FSL R5-0424]
METETTFKQRSQSFLEAICLTQRYTGLTAGFTTRDGGFSHAPYSSFNLGLHVSDSDEDVIDNRQKLADEIAYPLTSWVVGDQVHDSVIKKVTKEDKGSGTQSLQTAIAATDGLYTTETDLLLTSLYADCVPLYFIAPNHHTIGLAHAGWKGTVGQIGPEMVNRWKSDERIAARDIHVLIGPAISGQAYEVNDVVIDAVNQCLDQHDERPYITQANGRFLLDLKKLNKQLLVRSGVPEEQIYVSSICTASDDRMFSHRADNGQTGRMMSVIGQRK